MYGGALLGPYHLSPKLRRMVCHHRKGGVCEYKITLKDVFDSWQTQISIQATRRKQKTQRKASIDHSLWYRLIYYAYRSTQHKQNKKNAENRQLGRPTVNPGRPKMEKNPYTSARSTHR